MKMIFSIKKQEYDILHERKGYNMIVTKNIKIDKIKYLDYLPENPFFLDIETTGFSSRNGMIYLIGCGIIQKNEMQITQFMAASAGEEADILMDFSGLIKENHTIITFHGQGFDLPFIEARAAFHQIPLNLSQNQSLDLYRSIAPFKTMLGLMDCKQKTIESFLGIQREDQYSGGELIKVYQEFCNSFNQKQQEMLLLHNFEDVLGMLNLLPVLFYPMLFKHTLAFKTAVLQEYHDYNGALQKEYIITCSPFLPVPVPFSCHSRDQLFFLSGRNQELQLRIPLFHCTLKHFYSDYKNYDYLIQEDMAIHKSVSEFVDKKYKKKATPDTCYQKKEADFLPQPLPLFQPCFSESRKDKITYFIPDKNIEEQLTSENQYLSAILDHIKNK